ncbi:MAG: hypothetical protein ACK52I_22290 [Pseudomonadota bacterium]|jgi:hypothetical protein
MKKFFILSIMVAFLVSAGASIAAYASDNAEAAHKYELVAACSLLLGSNVATGKASVILGGFNRAYFAPGQDPYSRAEIALVNFLKNNKASQETYVNLQNQNIYVDTLTAALRFAIPISFTGTRDLITQSAQFFQGRIPEEWNQAQFPKGYNLAISHIQVGYASDASVTVPEGDVDFTNISDSWPAAFRNSQLRFSQAGALKGKYDVLFTGTKAAGQFNNVEGTGLELQAPMILEEGKATKLELITPQGVAFPATPANLFIEILLFGAVTRLKS